jgi:hypothetical protein
MLRAEDHAVMCKSRDEYRGRLECRMAVRSALALATFGMFLSLGVERAQAQDSAGQPGLSVSVAWLDQALNQQIRTDWRRRYIASPAFAVLGVGALVWPFAANSGTPATIASLATGAALLTTSIGTWANPDAYLAERWGTRFGHIAAMGLGATFLTECGFDAAHGACSEASLPVKRLAVALGAWEIGYQLTFLVLDLLLPPPDPRHVKLSVNAASDADYASVLAFLKERERRRRIGAYATFPWLALPPIGLFYFGSQLNEASARTVAYTFASVFTVLTVAALVYELLRTPDDVMLQRGQGPSD